MELTEIQIRHLREGLDIYKEKRQGLHAKASDLEKEAAEIKEIFKKPNNKRSSELNKIKHFLEDVEKWKIPGSDYRVPKLDNEIIGDAINETIKHLEQGSVFANERNALLTIMRLEGFGGGSGTCKLASAVLRFLAPKDWGVVDWRNASMLQRFDKYEWDIQKASSFDHYVDNKEAAYFKCKPTNIKECHKLEHMEKHNYKIISPYEAIGYNHMYRMIRDQSNDVFKTAAQVDMAIFGLSLLLW